jgi:hypothetical protein
MAEQNQIVTYQQQPLPPPPANEPTSQRDKDAMFGFIFILAIASAAYATYKATDQEDENAIPGPGETVESIKRQAKALLAANWLTGSSSVLIVLSIMAYAFFLDRRYQNAGFAGLIFVFSVPLIIASLVYLQYDREIEGITTGVIGGLTIFFAFMNLLWLILKDIGGKGYNMFNPMYWFRTVTGTRTEEEKYRGSFVDWFSTKQEEKEEIEKPKTWRERFFGKAQETKATEA